MAHANLVDGRLLIEVPLREKPLITQVPGAKVHDREGYVWRVPLSWASCKALRGVFGNYLVVGDALTDWAQNELDTRIAPSMLWREFSMQPEQAVEGVDDALRSYQQTAVCFLYTAQSALLGDDMGTGKSVMSAYVLPRLDAWPALIVAPKSMQRQWAREIEKWCDVGAVVLDGTAVKRRKTLEEFAASEEQKALVVTYDLIRIHSRHAGYGSMKLTDEEKAPKELNAISWGVVISDEAHRAKEPKAKQTRALWALGDDAQHCYALTGSVKTLDPAELWALMRFVSPKEWPSKGQFIERYCDTSFNPWGGIEKLTFKPERIDELKAVLDPRLLRRPKALVLPFLPQKVYVRRDVEMSPKQNKAYREMAEGMVADLDSGEQVMAFDPLLKAQRLTQFAKGSIELTEDGDVRMCEPSSTLDVFEEVLDELGDEPVAVFSLSRQLLDLAAARLTKRGRLYSSVVGGMDPNARMDAVDAFNDGLVDTVLVSLGAGAEGMSLTRGSTEIFLMRGSAIQNEQAEDRMHGIGRGDQNADQLTVIDLVTRDTVDEVRYENRVDGVDRMEGVLRDRDALRAALTHGLKEKKGTRR